MKIMEKNKIVQMMPGASTDIICSSLIKHFVSGRVGNLSCKNFIWEWIKLLSEGLKFLPTPQYIDKF